MPTGPPHAIKLELDSADGGDSIVRVEGAKIGKGAGCGQDGACHAADAPRGGVKVAAANGKFTERRQELIQRVGGCL
eukprot:3883729-Pleurochrysis_carterae.AAC.1